MTRALSTAVTSKGQVTIPLEVRELLGIRPRDRVRFVVRDGVVNIERSALSLEETFGAVQPSSSPQNFDDMVRSAKEERATRFMKKPRPR